MAEIQRIRAIAEDGTESTESWGTLEQAVAAFGPKHSDRYEQEGAEYILRRGDTDVGRIEIVRSHGHLRARLVWIPRRGYRHAGA